MVPISLVHDYDAMTPFGAKLRALRAERGVTQRVLAAELRVSPAYLSALEHGRRGAPSAGLVHQVNEFFGLIWDEAEELSRLARQSRPKVSIDTGGLAPNRPRSRTDWHRPSVGCRRTPSPQFTPSSTPSAARAEART